MTLQFNVPPEITLTVFDDDIYNEEHQMSEWYQNYENSQIAMLEYNGHFAELRACGEMRIIGTNDEIIRYTSDLFEYGFKTDNDLSNLEELGWYYEMNNCFELWFDVDGDEHGIFIDDLTSGFHQAIIWLLSTKESNV